MSVHRIRILPNQPIARVRPALHGHFAEHLGACIDGGVWVGDKSPIDHIGGIRTDVVEALRKIAPPVVRWPGGCFADDYHWTDGIGPRGSRPRRVNHFWGQSIETNEFGTHEFLNFCRLIGAEPYLAGNVGSGTVRELRDWVEYCNFPGASSLAKQRGQNGSPAPFNVNYWGVGNENWGCGGNFCPEDYAIEFRRYATYLGDYSEAAKLFLIACGPDSGRPEYHADWTRRFFKKIGRFDRIHGFAAHYYCGAAGTATKYSVDQWYELIDRARRIEDVITTHRAIMDEFDPAQRGGRRIGLLLDEWGTWHPPTPGRNPKHLWQQNTMRDALVAAVSLDAMHRHADKVVMANIAQVANVLQAMVLTDGDRMIVTPTYHVFDLYQAHRNGTSVPLKIETSDEVSFVVGAEKKRTPTLSGSATLHGDARAVISLVNAHATLPAEVEIDLAGRSLVDAEIAILSHADITAHNTFDEPQAVTITRARTRSSERVTLPPASVTLLTV